MKNERNLNKFLTVIRQKNNQIKKAKINSRFFFRLDELVSHLRGEYYCKPIINEWHGSFDTFLKNTAMLEWFALKECNLAFSQLWNIAIKTKNSNLKNSLVSLLKKIENPSEWIDASLSPLEDGYYLLRNLYVEHISQTGHITFAPTAWKFLQAGRPFTSYPHSDSFNNFNPADAFIEIESLLQSWNYRTLTSPTTNLKAIANGKEFSAWRAMQTYYRCHESRLCSELRQIDDKSYYPRNWDRVRVLRLLDFVISEIELRLREAPEILKGPQLKKHKAEECKKFAFSQIEAILTKIPAEERGDIQYKEMARKVKKAASSSNFEYLEFLSPTLIRGECRKVSKSINGGWKPKGGRPKGS